MAALMKRLSLFRYGYGKRYLAKTPLFFLSPVRLMEVMEKIEMLRGVESDLAAAAVGDRVFLFSLEYEEQMSFILAEAGKRPLDNKDLSVLSPLGAALLGSLPGAVVNVDFLGHRHRYLLLKVKKPAGSRIFNEKKEGSVLHGLP